MAQVMRAPIGTPAALHARPMAVRSASGPKSSTRREVMRMGTEIKNLPIEEAQRWLAAQLTPTTGASGTRVMVMRTTRLLPARQAGE